MSSLGLFAYFKTLNVSGTKKDSFATFLNFMG